MTKSPKKYRFSAKEVASMAGASESYVKKIRANKELFPKTEMVRKILEMDQLLMDGSAALKNELLEKFKSKEESQKMAGSD